MAQATQSAKDVVVSDEVANKVAEKMREGKMIPMALKELNLTLPILAVRKKIVEKFGQSIFNGLADTRFSVITKAICESGDLDRINRAIASCEDSLIRLKQKKAELTK